MAAGPTWDDIFEAARSDPPSPSERELPGWYKDDQNVADFGPAPLDDEVRVLECPDCGKAVLQEAFSFHQKNCQLIRDIGEGKVPASALEPTLKRSATALDGSDDEEEDEPLFSGSKRKFGALADDEDGPSGKKQKKKKGRGYRGPLDVDRQCGVMTDKGPCLRSLTCKSHSMGAKRAVEGRSRPYDELLFEWQKATNPAFVAKLEEKERAAAEAAEQKKLKLEQKLAAKKRRAGGNAAAAAAAAAAAGAAVAAAGGDAAAVAAAEKAAAKEASAGGTAERASAAGAAAAAAVVAAAAAAAAEDPEADMYTQGAGDAEVEAELANLLEALRRANAQPRMTCAPLAQRSPSTAFATRAHSLLQYRSLIANALRGHSAASSSSLGRR